MAELHQVLMKIVPFPDCKHPSKGNLRKNLLEEMADVHATFEYFIANNDFTEREAVEFFERVAYKLGKYEQWGLTGVKIKKTGKSR